MSNRNIDAVLDSYSVYLRRDDKKTADRFVRTRKSDRESALAEAITYQFLKTVGARPEINDKVGIGGPDFLCCASRFRRMPQDEFFVEATSLGLNAVTERSGLSSEMPKGISGRALGLVTENLCNKAKAKNRKFKNCIKPTVLAIVSSHLHGALLLDAHAAETALISGIHWRHEIGSEVADPNCYTDLKDSVFMRPGPNGSIEACRQNLSAILLISVYLDHSEVFGILHPEPKIPLNVALLPNLPFIRIAKWPVVDGKIWTEWVIGRPKGLRIPH